MPRLFSVSFPFRKKECFALVSIREKGVDMHCQVRYTDPQWNNLIGGKCFTFSLLEGLKQPATVADELTQALLLTTTRAIQTYLQEQSPAI